MAELVGPEIGKTGRWKKRRLFGNDTVFWEPYGCVLVKKSRIEYTPRLRAPQLHDYAQLPDESATVSSMQVYATIYAECIAAIKTTMVYPAAPISFKPISHQFQCDQWLLHVIKTGWHD